MDKKNKTIAVLGAAGATGQEVVSALLAKGYQVRAGVHNRNNLGVKPGLTIVKIDATKTDDQKKLLQGSDAVVSLLGHGRKTPPSMQQDAMKATLAAMQQHKITRIIMLTGTGVRQPGDTPNWWDNLLNASIKTIDPARIKDGQMASQLLQASGTDWTLLRVLKLTNQAKFKPVNLTDNGPAAWLTPRRQVAAAIIVLLESKKHIKKSPILS